MNKKVIDLTGQTFGEWTVVEYAGRVDSRHRAYWKCLCSCGNIKEIRGDNLRRGTTTRCVDCHPCKGINKERRKVIEWNCSRDM